MELSARACENSELRAFLLAIKPGDSGRGKLPIGGHLRPH
jgi:hypothetical protein